MTSTPDLSSAILGAMKNGSQPTAAALGFKNLVMLDEAILGDFPWFWQNGTNFNQKTFSWINRVFAYNSANDYVATNGENFVTSYAGVLTDIQYQLNSSDQDALNREILANATVVNSLITDWTTTFGAFPPSTPNTQAGQLSYISTQILTWGTPGLTLGALRISSNPMGLLPNVPLGAETIVSTFMTYLGDTSAVANIQEAQTSANSQLTQTHNNVTIPPATAVPGWMWIMDDSGQLQMVPQWNIDESTAVIQNALMPPAGPLPASWGNSFSTTLTASKMDSTTVKVQAEGGIMGAGSILDLIGIFGEANAQYNLWSFDESVTTVDVALQFNGVTTVTPAAVPYDVSTSHGWWNPQPIQLAVSHVAGDSGYQFGTDPHLSFGENGNFGMLSRLMISYQPIITLTFHTSNYSAFSQQISENSSWGVSFLGIPLAGGSQSYFKGTTSQDESGGTVTVTMTPPALTAPVTPADQLAYVIGAEILWPGSASN